MRFFRILSSLCLFMIFFITKAYGLNIVVSNSALEKIVKEIASTKQHVITLQSEKRDFHSFEPTFSQWNLIRNADLVVIVGTEHWATKVYQIRANKPLLTLARGQTRFVDPHLWFDLNRVKRLASDLVQFLEVRDPGNKIFYRERLQQFLKSLNLLEAKIKDLKNCQYKEVYILGHPVFSYLLTPCGIKEKTLIKGHHKEGEPSAKTLTEMLQNIQKRNPKIVFITDPEFENYASLFKSKGVKVVTLWSGGTYRFQGSFTELLDYNLSWLRHALSCGK